MSKDNAGDPAAVARHERFGKLPESIGFESMTEEKRSGPNAGEATTYNPEGTWNFYSCLALDLGL